MTIERLKEIVDEKFNLDISEKNSKRHYVYAKTVFSKIAHELGYDYCRIKHVLNIKQHGTIMHHVNTADKIYKYHKITHNEIVLEYGLDVKLFVLKEPLSSADNHVYKTITNELLKFTESQLIDFKDTRLKPYLKMLGN